MGFIDAIKKVAPLLGGLLGGPAGGVATKLISSALGTDDDVDAIREAVAKDPKAALKLRELENAHATRLQELSIQAEAQQLQHDTELIRGQTKLNLADSRSGSFWKGGWRPAIGWTCAVSLLWHFVLHEWITWGVALWAPHVTPPPDVDFAPLLGIVIPLLGLGGLRTMEKIKSGSAAAFR